MDRSEVSSTQPAVSARRRPFPHVPTLPRALQVFVQQESPRLLLASVLVVVTARLAVGDWTWADAAVIGALVILQPLSEWLIHVFILHVEPRGPITGLIDRAAGRSHREHHADPTDLDHVFIHRYVTRATLLLAVFLGVVVFPLAPLVASGLVTSTTLTLLYEWTHFLIHSDLQPRTRLGRAIRRNHRLHHFRNERYWFGVVSPGGDLLLGTAPDKADVPVSPTARTAEASLAR